MDQKVLDLYDAYAGGSLDRRGFLKRLAVLAGGTAAACTLLPLLENSHLRAQVVARDDPGCMSKTSNTPRPLAR